MNKTRRHPISRYHSTVIFTLFIAITSMIISHNRPVWGVPIYDKPSRVNFSSTQTVFREDFNDSSIDPNMWQVFNNGGEANIQDGFIILSKSEISGNFPYVHSKINPFALVGNFSVKFGIQYIAVNNYGNGLAIDDNTPQNGAPGVFTWQPTVYNFWQDGERRLYISDFQNEYRYQTQEANINYHDIEFRWVGKYDEYYVDGNLVNRILRSSNVPRPTTIWFGNPISAGPSKWTNFKIDYIEVTDLGGIVFLPLVKK